MLVHGPAGVGKTALTEAVASDPAVVERFGEANRYFVSLETVRSGDALADAVAKAIGTATGPGIDDLAQMLNRTGGLLVLDNLETPFDAAPRETEAALAAIAKADQLAVLASFRGATRVAAPWVLVHTVTVLEEPHDKALFCRVSQNEWEGDEALPQFLKALAGLPLAIELVAHRAFGKPTLARLWRDWERIGAGMANRYDADHRLDSLAVSIGLSLDSSSMTEPAKRLFALLGVLPAGIHWDDLDALLGDDASDAASALEDLALAHTPEGTERLDMLPPIRDHAARHHPPDARYDWQGHYLACAREAEAQTTVPRLLPEFPNIDAAVNAAMREGRHAEVAKATQGLHRLTNLGSLPAAPFWTSLAAAFAESELSQTGWCWYNAGICAFNRSDADGARKAYCKALPLYRQVGEVLGEANCILSLGDIARRRSDHDGARQAYEEALPLYRQVGSVWGEANCILSLGDIALWRSDHDSARKAYEEALPLFRQVGNVRGEANCIQKLGDIALWRYDHDSAREAYEEALSLYRRVGEVLGEANCILSLGDIARRRSDHDGARQAYEEALPLYRQVGSVWGEANCIKSLGDIALRQSDHDGARQAYEEALPLYRQVGSVIGEANCTEGFGDLAKAAGDTDGAATRYGEAVAMWERFGNSAQAARVQAKKDAL